MFFDVNFLSSYGPGFSFEVTDINNHEQVVGNLTAYQHLPNPFPYFDSFSSAILLPAYTIYAGHSDHPLTPDPRNVSAYAHAINDHGHVLLSIYGEIGGVVYIAGGFIYEIETATLTPISPYFQPTDLNSGGYFDAVYFVGSSNGHPALGTYPVPANGEPPEPGFLDFSAWAGDNGVLASINDSGQIVGYGTRSGIPDDYDGFLFNLHGSEFHYLRDVFGGMEALKAKVGLEIGGITPNGISDSGSIVGSFAVGIYDVPFVYRNGVVTIVEVGLEGELKLVSINDDDTIIGFTETATPVNISIQLPHLFSSETDRVDFDGGDNELLPAQRRAIDTGAFLYDAGDGMDFVRLPDFDTIGSSIPFDHTRIFHGGDGDDQLIAGSLGNRMSGDAGNDTLISWASPDELIGGDGEDSVSYLSDNTGVTVSLLTNRGMGGHAEGDILDGIENLSGGAGHDFFIGNSDDNKLYGADGNDTLIGGTGNDTIDGGEGSDNAVFNVASESATVVRNADGSITVTSADGEDILFGIEQLQFIDLVTDTTNRAPSSVALTTPLSAITEGTSADERILIGLIKVTDDFFGANTLGLTGADAGYFEIDGNELYLKAGTILDFERKPSYSVAVTADDPTIGSAPDAVSAVHTLQIANIVEGSEISVTGSGRPIERGDINPDAADGTAFGNVAVGGAATHVFTVMNIGDQPLKITSPKAPSGFKFGADTLASSIAPGGSDTFSLVMDTAKAGPRGGVVQFTTNDADETLFNFAVSGQVIVLPSEIEVSGDGLDIASNDTAPDAADGTDFGIVAVGTSVVQTFLVENTGPGTLTTSKLVIPKGFKLGADKLATSIASGASDTFTVIMDTAKAGARGGTVSFATNDSDETAFKFNLAGNVIVLPPELEISGGGLDIVQGDTTPSTGDGTDFGTALIKSSVIHTFTVHNTGPGVLNITKVVAPKGFKLGADKLGKTIAPGGEDTFTVIMDTAKAGLRTGTLSITTNDGDESPFNFALSGEVVVGTAAPTARTSFDASAFDLPAAATFSGDEGNASGRDPFFIWSHNLDLL
jgi:Ca2+-binding RTX toxin-like protein